MSIKNTLANVVIHADWGVSPKKRWMTRAVWEGNAYHVTAPIPFGRSEDFLRDLKNELTEHDTAVVGFDFPIGLPYAYARTAGITNFIQFLRQIGQDHWRDFYSVAKEKVEVSIYRPFYPNSPGKKKLAHLLEALELKERIDLLRICERPNSNRGAACPLFWTLGPKQVGKGALSGWKEILIPLLQDFQTRVGIWPFHGNLRKLIGEYQIVVTETYPAEAYRHFHIPSSKWSKRNQLHRKQSYSQILKWEDSKSEIQFNPEVTRTINDGFGESKDGEDQFDSFIGLCFMLEVILGNLPDGAPDKNAIHNIEGWILGASTDSQ